ncbi:SMP-30/gluconolactonase/LRE family protein [Horticoccus sp. 23ND18S-11]|uniref:hypothetical protein n=1 Tax=Horticoccus sp. 23ND18S-11 TaxID=3391832 RepID=UPI0039C9AAAB
MRLLFAATVLAFVPLTAAEKTHLDFRAEAQAAYLRKDFTAARAATLAALELRPDSPRYLTNFAALSALTGDDATAIETLRELADLGVGPPIERDPDFARLQGTPPFLRVIQQLAANREPKGEAEIIATLAGRTGIIEGIAHRTSTGDLFLGDVHHRCIWRRDRTGQITRFSAENEELLGIFGLALDESRQALWAAMTAVPEMDGFTADQKGHSGLAEFDLATSELRRVIPLAGDGRQNALGDLIVGPDGTIYATDSKAPVVWKLAPGAEDFEKVADSPLFSSLQGLVLQKQTLLVADYANGLFAVDLPTGNVTALHSPKKTTLLGLDGLILTPAGIVATQNGVEPERVIRLTLSPAWDAVTGVTVLASGHAQLSDLSLLTMVSDRLTVIAGAGWQGFDPAKTPHPPAHPVHLFQIALP